MTQDRVLKIRRGLEDKGVTLTAIADELGVSCQMVSLVIREKATSARVRRAIADKLGWNPWEGERSPPPAA